MVRPILIAVILFMGVMKCEAQDGAAGEPFKNDLVLTVSPTKSTFQDGEVPSIIVNLKNVSSHDLDLILYPDDNLGLQFRSVGNSPIMKKIENHSPVGLNSTDYRTLEAGKSKTFRFYLTKLNYRLAAGSYTLVVTCHLKAQIAKEKADDSYSAVILEAKPFSFTVIRKPHNADSHGPTNNGLELSVTSLKEEYRFREIPMIQLSIQNVSDHTMYVSHTLRHPGFAVMVTGDQLLISEASADASTSQDDIGDATGFELEPDEIKSVIVPIDKLGQQLLPAQQLNPGQYIVTATYYCGFKTRDNVLDFGSPPEPILLKSNKAGLIVTP